MNELVIKTHNFELAKRGLKEFSQKKTDELKIDTVKTDGGFLGLGDHKVTGSELNSRLSTIQQHLIDLNTTNNRTIKEFGQVYSALEALDKDYIQAILISIKATEKTSERIQATQEQIKKIVEDQKKTLEVLKRFKQKLDGYAHLEDIDKIWSDCQKWYSEITALSNSISSAKAISKANAQKADEIKTVLKGTETKLNDLSKHLNQQIVKLEAIISFTSKLEKIVHLQDIDEMWDSLSNAHTSLANISNELSSFKDTASKQQDDIKTVLKGTETELNDLSKHLNQQIVKLEAIISFTSKLEKIVHLQDIDEMWDSLSNAHTSLANNSNELSSFKDTASKQQSDIETLLSFMGNLSSCKHLNDIDDIWNSSEMHSIQLSELEKQSDEIKSIVQSIKENTDAAIASVVEKNDTAVQKLTKKIKYAYLLAGGSFGLAIIELIVILLKVE